MIRTVIRACGPALCLLFGYVLKKTGLLSPQEMAGVKKFIVRICMTALIFTAFAGLTLEKTLIGSLLLLTAVQLALFFVGAVLGKLTGLGPYFKFMLVSADITGLGFALFPYFFGEEGLSALAVPNLGQMIPMNLLFLPMLIQLGKRRKAPEAAGSGLKSVLSAMLHTPMLWATVLGLAYRNVPFLYALGQTEAGQLVLGQVKAFGSIATVVICMIVGYELSFEAKNLKPAFVTAALRLVICGVIGALLYCLCGAFISGGKVGALAVLTAYLLPVNMIIPAIISETAGSEEAGAACTASSLGVLLSLPLIIVVMTALSA